MSAVDWMCLLKMRELASLGNGGVALRMLVGWQCMYDCTALVSSDFAQQAKLIVFIRYIHCN